MTQLIIFDKIIGENLPATYLLDLGAGKRDGGTQGKGDLPPGMQEGEAGDQGEENVSRVEGKVAETIRGAEHRLACFVPFIAKSREKIGQFFSS